MKPAVFAFLFLSVFVSGLFGADVITATEAMARAEAFVLANGYTDAPPTKSAAELDSESFERTPPETWLAARRGLLESRAWGFKRGSRFDDQGWSILILIKQKPAFKMRPDETAYAKMVQMDRYGAQLLVGHGVVIAYGTTQFNTFTQRKDLPNRH